jgi:hypothetical protein
MCSFVGPTGNTSLQFLPKNVSIGNLSIAWVSFGAHLEHSSRMLLGGLSFLFLLGVCNVLICSTRNWQHNRQPRGVAETPRRWGKVSVHLSCERGKTLSGLNIFLDAVSTIPCFWQKTEKRTAPVGEGGQGQPYRHVEGPCQVSQSRVHGDHQVKALHQRGSVEEGCIRPSRSPSAIRRMANGRPGALICSVPCPCCKLINSTSGTAARGAN